MPIRFSSEPPSSAGARRASSLGYEELRRAHAVLSELGIERHSAGEAKLEAQSIPAYVAAEADYEECSRLCQTL